jgi:hypothetical protein
MGRGNCQALAAWVQRIKCSLCKKEKKNPPDQETRETVFSLSMPLISGQDDRRLGLPW